MGKWIKRFELLLGAMYVKNSEQDELRKRCLLLLHYLVAEVFELYETLDDETATYVSAKHALSEYFTPKHPKHIKDFVFRNI